MSEHDGQICYISISRQPSENVDSPSVLCHTVQNQPTTPFNTSAVNKWKQWHAVTQMYSVNHTKSANSFAIVT